jgi:hypothetical protein
MLRDQLMTLLPTATVGPLPEDALDWDENQWRHRRETALIELALLGVYLLGSAATVLGMRYLAVWL